VSISTVGSGVLISNDGKVLTAAHVVELADEIRVGFLSGETIFAEVVASEPRADVALLRLERMPDQPVIARLADSDKAKVGQQVFVVGAPYGEEHTLTVGHISARHSRDDRESGFPLAEFFQTDAAINEGNSGGPMFSLDGEVIGVVSHILSQSGGFEGLGFVVTSNTARRLLMEQRSVWSGISGYRLEGELAQALNVPRPAGVLVQQVAKWSPAAKLGLHGGSMRAEIANESLILGGDVILAIQGIALDSPDAYEAIRHVMSKLRRGDSIRFTILREGRVADIEGPWID
jgi:S1-C subfamily serine protease